MIQLTHIQSRNYVVKMHTWSSDWKRVIIVIIMAEYVLVSRLVSLVWLDRCDRLLLGLARLVEGYVTYDTWIS
jgi:hypothetical protein